VASLLGFILTFVDHHGIQDLSGKRRFALRIQMDICLALLPTTNCLRIGLRGQCTMDAGRMAKLTI
jgi:hypothetical protein